MFNPTDYLDNKGLELNFFTKTVIIDNLDLLTKKILKAQEDNKLFFVDAFTRMKNDYIRDLESLGIKVAYGWPGHRGEWFFPTEDEVWMYDDWLVQCSD